MTEVMATHAWRSNAHLIADVASLGYIGDEVLDATYGEGAFWNVWRPRLLTTNDQHKNQANGKGDALLGYDFRRFPPHWLNRWPTVVYDPPYKLSGTPALGQFDNAYGIDKAMPWQARMAMILRGAAECYRITTSGGTLLVKVQDQVCSGHMVWQTDEVWGLLRRGRAQKVARFNLITTPRPQPGKQVHARNNTSQLLVFRKP